MHRHFAEMKQHAARAATALASAGVRRSDTVLILLSREIEWWELMLACLRLGAIATPGTIQLTPKDIAYRRTASAATCIVAGGEVAARVDAALATDPIVRIPIGGSREGG